jgi:hypothetical protein
LLTAKGLLTAWLYGKIGAMGGKSAFVEHYAKSMRQFINDTVLTPPVAIPHALICRNIN